MLSLYCHSLHGQYRWDKLVLRHILKSSFGKIDPEKGHLTIRGSKSSIVLISNLEKRARHYSEVLFLILFKASHKLADMIHSVTLQVKFVHMSLHPASSWHYQILILRYLKFAYWSYRCNMIAESLNSR